VTLAITVWEAIESPPPTLGLASIKNENHPFIKIGKFDGNGF
jgi:hypothetical protein